MAKAAAGIMTDLETLYLQALKTDGHCRHESGHAVVAALCDFRVVKIIFPRAIIDANGHSSFGSFSGPLSDDGEAWMQTFDDCRALSKYRRMAVVALSGLYSQFKDCRGHPKIPRAMRSAGANDIRYASSQIREIMQEEGTSKAAVRRQVKAFTQMILQREYVSRAINEIAAAYRHHLNAGTALSEGEFCAILDGLIRN